MKEMDAMRKMKEKKRTVNECQRSRPLLRTFFSPSLALLFSTYFSVSFVVLTGTQTWVDHKKKIIYYFSWQ